MRWLQNISLSSPSSSSSSSSTTGSMSVTSAAKRIQGNGTTTNNHNYNQRDHKQRPNSRYHYLGFRIAGGRLTRHRELSHLSDREVAQTREVVVLAPQSSSYDTPLSSSAPASRTTSSALAVPLPLPVPEGDGEQRLPSPNEVGHGKGLEDRERDKADGAPFNSSMLASRDSMKTTEHLDSRSPSRVLHQEVNKGESSRDEFRVHFPIRSAPTSPYSSPVITPPRMSTMDIFPRYMVSTSNQAWSAPEMPTLDIPGLPPPAFYDINAFSTDNTPPQSPPNRSPHRKNRSQSGPPSPIHQRLSREISSSQPEINVHPLPLPPGAVMGSPLASIPQVTSKPEALPMNSQWQKGKLVGRGTFGSVYVASNRETGALCAMKEVEIFPDDPKSAECMKQLEQEIKVLSQFKHPNIVQYYGSEIVEDKFYIYLEYVHPGSINKYVRDHCGAITESVVRNFTRHILSGLAYLHSMKTIHRDIKGANLLVDASGVVKLADFGMSKHLTGQRADLSLKGSPYWMAPELMQAVMQKDNSSDLALAVDIWSLGCTIIEMFTGKAPWSEYEGAAAMFKVMRDTPPIPETLSPEGKDFLRCCFRRNPAERPPASTLLEHRFVKSSPQSGPSSSTSFFNGIKSMDITFSPWERSEFKLDQLPVQQSLRSTKTVTPDNCMDGAYAEIVVVRHGETEWNADGRIQGHLDVELNEAGKQQAALVADRLSKEPNISAVYSSDLKRALVTAEMIAAKCGGLEVITDPDLRERNLGDLQGLVLREAAKLNTKAYKAFLSHRTDQDIPGDGESRDQLFQRCTLSLQRIGRKHKGERVVVVSHGGVIGSLHKRACPDGKPGVKVLNTSISIFHLSDEEWTIKSWGDVSHLNKTGYLKSGFGGDKTSG